ncbi:unnamed protein product, partial [Polarella glacialis]
RGKQEGDVQQLLCDVYDLRDTFCNTMYWHKGVVRTVTEYNAAKATYFEKKAGPFFDKYESWLKLHGSAFFAGPRPTAADFHIWEMLDQHELYAKDLGQASPCATRPALKAFYDKFRALEKLQAYFNSEAYKLPCNVSTLAFWSGPGSSIPADAPK